MIPSTRLGVPNNNTPARLLSFPSLPQPQQAPTYARNTGSYHISVFAPRNPTLVSPLFSSISVCCGLPASCSVRAAARPRRR